jgi:hypothetical protein
MLAFISIQGTIKTPDVNRVNHMNIHLPIFFIPESKTSSTDAHIS